MGCGSSKDTTTETPKQAPASSTKVEPSPEAAKKTENKPAEASNNTQEANNPTESVQEISKTPANKPTKLEEQPSKPQQPTPVSTGYNTPPLKAPMAKTTKELEEEALQNNWDQSRNATPANYTASKRNAAPLADWGEGNKEPVATKQTDKRAQKETDEDEKIPPEVAQRCEELARRIAKVMKTPNLSYPKYTEDINFIYKAVNDYRSDPHVIKGFCKKLVQVKFVEMLKSMWKALFNEKLFEESTAVESKPGEVKLDNNKGNLIFENVDYMLTSLWYLCDGDKSDEIILKRVAETKFDEDIIGYLKSDTMKSFKLKEISKKSQTAKGLVDILHRMAKTMPERRQTLRKLGAVQLLQDIRDCRNISLTGSALLAQSLLINEEENEKYNSKPETFKMLYDMLESSVKSPAPYHLTNEPTFNTKDVVLVINRLASMDGNVDRLLDAGIATEYRKLLAKSQDGIDFLAAKGLWMLSYKGHKRVAKESFLTKALRQLLDHQDKLTAFGAEGALWVIKGKMEENAALWKQEFAEESHRNFRNKRALASRVYFSNQMSSDKLVDKLIKELREEGIESIKSNDIDLAPLEERCRTIEDSSFVLIVMTESYKESPLCRFDAEYARKLGKPCITLSVNTDGYVVDGWLAAYIKETKCFDYSIESAFAETTSNLIVILLPVNGGLIGEDGSISNLSNDYGYSPPRGINNYNSIPYTWTRADVLKWLNDNGLSSTKPKSPFKEETFDGMQLGELMRLRYEEPSSYFNQMFKELSTDEVLRLTRASRELHKRMDKQ